MSVASSADTAPAPATRLERWLPLILLLLTLSFWAGLMGWALSAARLGPQASGSVVVVFPWGAPAHEMFAVLRAADGRLERTTWFGNVWVVYGETAGFVGRLEAAGARGVYSPLMFQPMALGGCFGVPSAGDSPVSPLTSSPRR